jgi:hypothetical protein
MSDAEELVPWVEPFPASQQELLTRQFYDWEKRGRGWQLWNCPVELEPPFRPFIAHWVPAGPVVDDARKPTALSAWADKIFGRSPHPSPSATWSLSIPEEDLTEPESAVFFDDAPLAELQMTLPQNLKVTQSAAEQFLLSLTYCASPLSFELVGLPESIVVQFVCREGDYPQLHKQLRAYFPEAVASEESGFLASHWDQSDDRQSVLVDFGLSREFMVPLQTSAGFEVDPLIATAGALSGLCEGEMGVFQVLFQAARSPWPESISRAVTDFEGRAFFADAPEIAAAAKQKIARPLFVAAVRVAAQSSTYERAWEIARDIGGSLAQFSSPSRNELIPLANDGYGELEHETDLLYRLTHRSGMILNSEELVSFLHLPSLSVRAEKLKRETKKTKTAPAIAVGHTLVLGENTHAGATARVTLSPQQRTKHMYVVGASGTGKSTLLFNLILQDIRNGEGVGVLDPHGDLIEQVLGAIPEERLNDVLLLDPSDEEYPVGFNILSAHSSFEKTLLSSDLVAVFRRLSTSWGDQMTSVLGNAILAFLESERGGTLFDLRRFLVEAQFRNEFLETVKDSHVQYFWHKEFPLLAGKPQAPILTRLDTFLRPKLIRNMVQQRKNRLDFASIMDGRKIFLGKLAQGAIGEENAYLLGTLIVSKMHQIAMARQSAAETKRQPFYLYIDEFQNFITPSMAAILSGARKYHLGLILAHQELRQLWNKDTDVASAVIANASTRVCFRLGDFDAQKLEDGFSFFDAKDLQSLGVGEAIARIERNDYDFNLRTLPVPPLDNETSIQKRERLVALSREQHASRREDVEAAMQDVHITRPAPPVTRTAEATYIKEALTPSSPPVVSEKVKAQEKLTRREPAPLGRGGAQHIYLQQLIKRLAEDKGYRATIEQPVLGGTGSVDVSLEKAGRRIACEISVTSTCEYELGNIEKCLAAGFDHVVFLSSERKIVSTVKQLASTHLDEYSLQKILFFLPEEFVEYLEQMEAQDAAKEETVRGYKVKVNYRPLAEGEKKTRKQAISQVILKALKRMKGADS